MEKTDRTPMESKRKLTVPDQLQMPAAIDMIHREPSPVPQAIGDGAPKPEAPATALVLAGSKPYSAAYLVEHSGVTPTLEQATVASPPGFSPAPDPGLTMYFDIGSFKDENSAHSLSTRVGELGLPTTVARKGHLWANAYQVLVGPYGDRQEEKRLENSLVAHGFKPLPFEKGSRGFVFVSPLVLRSAMLPIGDITIRWESFASDAKVKFLQGGNLLATADGRWMPGAKKYWRDEYVYLKNGNGLRTLVEIHFSGLNRRLVFRD